MQNFDKVEVKEGDGEVRANRWRSFGQTSDSWDPRLKINNEGLYRTREVSVIPEQDRTL